MSKINVGALRGGPSLEYDMSLISGQAVIDALDSLGYNCLDIYIDKEAKWHLSGLPVKPFDILPKLDVVFNALHGDYGEDGRVQSILEKADIPFTGSGAFASALTYHRALALSELKRNGIDKLSFQGQLFLNSADLMDKSIDEISDMVFESFPPPYLVKPVRGNSDFGVTVANTKSELENIIAKILIEYDELVVEEFIFGEELVVSLTENLREQDIYLSPIFKILKKEKKVFDYSLSYLSATEKTFSKSNIPERDKEKVYRISKEIFRGLGIRDYSLMHFIITADSRVFFVKAQTLPGLSHEALYPKTLEYLGFEYDDIIEHILKLALNRK